MYTVLLTAGMLVTSPAQAPAGNGCVGVRATYQTYALQTFAIPVQAQGCVGSYTAAPEVQANGCTGGGFLARRHDRVQARRAARHSVAIVEAVPVQTQGFVVPQGTQSVQQAQYFAPPPPVTIAVASPVYYSQPFSAPVRTFFRQRVCDPYGNCYYQ